MEYLDIQLKITGIAGHGYLVSIVTSEDGEAEETIPSLMADVTFQSMINHVLRATRSTRFTSQTSDAQPSRDMIPVDDEEQDSVAVTPSIAVRTFGTKLFDSIFAGRIGSCYRTSLANARRQKKGLRLRLHLNSPDIAALPWEFLFDESEGEYVSLTRETPIVRYVEMSRARQSVTIQPPLRILAMTASPTDLPKLDVSQERKRMEDAVEHLTDNGMIELEWLDGETREDLQSRLKKREWHIFHFIGHGGFD